MLDEVEHVWEMVGEVDFEGLQVVIWTCAGVTLFTRVSSSKSSECCRE